MISRLVRLLPTPALERLTVWRDASPALQALARWATRSMRDRVVVVRRGEAAGLRLDTRGAPVFYGIGAAEPEAQAVVARWLNPGDVFYDVGANVGFFTLIGARRVGESGRVVAFEPAPTTRAALERNVRLNGFENVDVVEAAASDAAGSATFVVPPGANQQAHLVGRGGAGDGEEITVRTATLDALVAEGLPPPTFVKMDVEGAEVAALSGAEAMLRKHRPVVLCEAHGTGPEVVAFFRRLGYAVEGVGVDVEGPWPETAHVLATPPR